MIKTKQDNRDACLIHILIFLVKCLQKNAKIAKHLDTILPQVFEKSFNLDIFVNLLASMKQSTNLFH